MPVYITLLFVLKKTCLKNNKTLLRSRNNLHGYAPEYVHGYLRDHFGHIFPSFLESSKRDALIFIYLTCLNVDSQVFLYVIFTVSIQYMNAYHPYQCIP